MSYLQGLAPKIEFQDRARVSATGLRSCVPVNCYGDVVLIDEWNPLETAGVHQLKYYAPGVGNIRVGAAGDPEAEELVLVKVVRLGPAAGGRGPQACAPAREPRLHSRQRSLSTDATY